MSPLHAIYIFCLSVERQIFVRKKRDKGYWCLVNSTWRKKIHNRRGVVFNIFQRSFAISYISNKSTILISHFNQIFPIDNLLPVGFKGTKVAQHWIPLWLTGVACKLFQTHLITIRNPYQLLSYFNIPGIFFEVILTVRVQTLEIGLVCVLSTGVTLTCLFKSLQHFSQHSVFP